MKFLDKEYCKFYNIDVSIISNGGYPAIQIDFEDGYKIIKDDSYGQLGDILDKEISSHYIQTRKKKILKIKNKLDE